MELSLNVYDENLVLESADFRKYIYVEEDLQKAKDYIVISSLTGMRFESMKDSINSEAKVFKDDNYNFKYSHSKYNKTSIEVYIPLLKPVLDIIGRMVINCQFLTIMVKLINY
jgi:predicted class III extradiol MEMO1 family dioxygenase